MRTQTEAARRLRLFEIALMIALAVFLISGARALQTGDQLADRVVRLHVLANSDSEEDQALKLLVRDAVLAQAETILRQSSNRTDAEARLKEQLPALEQTARETVAANGYDYGAAVELTEMPFPTREYEGFTLPAGNYLSLRVLIGEGAGRNWWCVVFPPLCAAVSGDVPSAALAAGLTEEQVGLITESEGYVLKSKAVEFWQSLRAKWD